jgi:hypothetical protein
MNAHAHSRISDNDEIPDLCKKTFVSIDSAVKILWVVAIVLVLPASIAGIGWSIAIGKEQLRQDTRLVEIEGRQNALNTQINEKLDILIKRGDQ